MFLINKFDYAHLCKANLDVILRSCNNIALTQYNINIIVIIFAEVRDHNAVPSSLIAVIFC